MAGTQVTTVDGKQLSVVIEPTIEVIEEGVGNPDGGQQVATVTTEPPVGVYEHVEEDRTGNAEGQGEGTDVARQGETPQQISARARRRRALAATRDRERQELVRYKQENAELRQQVAQALVHVDKRMATVEISAIDGQIAQLETEIDKADRVIGAAITANNGDDATTAMRIRDTLRDRLNELKLGKARQVEARQQVTATDTRTAATDPNAGLPPGVTRAQVNNYNLFTSKFPWYDPKGGDQDSKRLKAIDKELQDTGSDPNMASHWIELEKRVREEFSDPDAAGNGTAQRPVSRANGAGGPKLPGAGAASGGGGGNIKFHLSAERKQALVDLGVYGTPDQNKYIKAYMAFDKAQPKKQ